MSQSRRITYNNAQSLQIGKQYRVVINSNTIGTRSYMQFTDTLASTHITEMAITLGFYNGVKVALFDDGHGALEMTAQAVTRKQSED